MDCIFCKLANGSPKQRDILNLPVPIRPQIVSELLKQSVAMDERLAWCRQSGVAGRWWIEVFASPANQDPIEGKGHLQRGREV